jgi:hypothetical protein
MPAPRSALLPGFYPEIKKVKPKIGGVDNIGIGVDQGGVEYVLKAGSKVCIAEFVGAACCDAVGVPCARPVIVQRKHLIKPTELLVGSEFVPGLLMFNMRDISEWRQVVAALANAAAFSGVLAVDLAVGNDDRHQDNWLVKDRVPGFPVAAPLLMAVDFSRAWPVHHPPQPPRQHQSPNTWNFVSKWWDAIGVTYDKFHFHQACAKMGSLDEDWIRSVLTPMVEVWLNSNEFDALCSWWRVHWREHVIDVIQALEADGDW